MEKRREKEIKYKWRKSEKKRNGGKERKRVKNNG